MFVTLLMHNIIVDVYHVSGFKNGKIISEIQLVPHASRIVLNIACILDLMKCVMFDYVNLWLCALVKLDECSVYVES